MGSKSQQQVQVAPSATAAILVVMYIAAFVAAFNENIINVALHDIMAAFSVSATTAQWLVSGYMIVTSIFTAIMAFLSGRFSTRKLLFFACGCMVAGEVLCLIAPSFSVLLPSRILQAAGSGILFPLMMNVVLSCAPREKLGLYLSLGGACITLGPAFGPVISGLMCTLFGWRAVFVVPLVGGIVVAAAGVKLVQNVGERSNTTLDILSVVLLAADITAFVYSVGEFSTNLIAGIVALFAAIVLLGLFAARQLKLEHPVLNVRPMASVRFWPACLLVVVSMMTTFSMSEEMVQKIRDPFVTTRTTRKVGMGIPFMDMVTKQCGGHLLIQSRKGKGTVVEAAFAKDNIDRPPLGDIVSSIKVLLVGTPYLELKFIYKIGTSGFDIDTRVIRSLLGDEADFTRPEVYTWFEEYLKQEISQLRCEQEV